MKPAVAQRLVGLAALALVAGIAALAVTRNNSDSSPRSSFPEAAPAPGGGWYHALAAPVPVPRKPRRTACGEKLKAATLGVSHPVLPCNVKIFIEYGDQQVLTQVIERNTNPGSPDFTLTKALADKIDLHGVQPIKWRLATEPEK
jgi:hypothetical protein